MDKAPLGILPIPIISIETQSFLPSKPTKNAIILATIFVI